MSDNITVAELDEKLKELVNWERFGIHLIGITYNDIEKIKEECRLVDDRKRALYNKWLKQCVTPKWEKVVVALEIAGEKTLARELRKRHSLIITADYHSSGHDQQHEIVAFDEETVQLLTSLRNVFVDVSYDCAIELKKRVQNGQIKMPDVIMYTKHVCSSIYDLKGLNDIQTDNSFFDVISPHYHFLDFYLLEKLAKQFLDPSIALNELNTHSMNVENLLKQEKIKSLHQSIRQCLTKSPQEKPITLQVRNAWKKVSIYSVQVFLQVLLNLDHVGIAKLFNITTGSLIITVLLPEHITALLMTHTKHKIEFMRLTGIISLQVGDTYILQDEEEMADEEYTFEMGLIKSAQASNIEAVKFLLEYLQTDINTQTYKPSSVDNDKKNTEQPANTTMPTTADNVKEPAINNTTIGQQKTLETTTQHIFQTNTLPSEAKPDEKLQSKKKSSTEPHPADKIKRDSNNNVSFIHDDGTSALMIASYNDDIDLLELLLVKGADPNLSTSGAGWTALMYGAGIGSIRVVNMILNYKAKPDIKKLSTGATALMYACLDGDLRIVSTLLNHSADPNIQTNNGTTPLFIASQNGHMKVVERLLQAKAIPETPRNDGATPLYIASQNGQLKVVKRLLKAKVNPDSQIVNGATPLYIASHEGHLEVVETLLQQAKVNPDIRKDTGATPLYIASQNGHLQIVERLLQVKVNPNTPKDTGATPLFIASQEGHLEVVKRLLQANVNPDTPRNDGATPLMVASEFGHSNIVELLLNHNADSTKQSHDGSTALSIAKNKGHVKVMQLLDFS